MYGRGWTPERVFEVLHRVDGMVIRAEDGDLRVADGCLDEQDVCLRCSSPWSARTGERRPGCCVGCDSGRARKAKNSEMAAVASPISIATSV